MRTSPFISGSALSRLECARCRARHDPEGLQSVCTDCGGPLLARYELSRPDLRGLHWDLPHRPADIWRYAELLPVRSPGYRIGLGEGMTPMLAAPRLGEQLGLERLWVKDEGRNPTGSFKSRGMAVAVARAAELGARALIAPSAGNAGLALATYAARHGLRSMVAFPEDIPPAFVREARFFGSEVIVAGATIREAAAALHQRIGDGPNGFWRNAFDVSTLREPYRLEGKKTMGYEIAEQLGEPPHVIVYPTGGGTGLVGIVKAFEELTALGWVEEGTLPRMIAVQMEGCAPIVRAWRDRAKRAEAWAEPATRCWGLRVPSPFADLEILEILHRTHGSAIAVAEEDLLPVCRKAARLEGLDVCPEGAAALSALSILKRDGLLRADERVVVLNTASSGLYK